MIALKSLEDTESWVNKQKNKGVDVRWDGWNLVFHIPDPTAERNVEGRYSRASELWGFETTIEPNEEFQWLVNHRLTRGKNARR